MFRRDLIAGAAGAIVSSLSGLAHGQASPFPKPGVPIKFVVPFPAGGLGDVMTRPVAQRLSANWGVPVIVDNKPGASAQLGSDFVAKAAPDGHTLLAITLTSASNVTLFPNGPFSFERDLRPVALLSSSPMLVLVPANSPIATFQDLMRVSKTKLLNAGTNGIGSPPHLVLELFSQLNGSKMNHVPYRGDALSLADLVGGQVDVSFGNYPPAIQHVKSGRLRALAVCSLGRLPALPAVPTAMESGMPGLFVENWNAVMMPAKTPDAIVEKYSRELVKVMYTPELEKAAQTLGFKITAKGSDEFGRFLKNEIGRWRGIIKAAKIAPQG